MDAQLTQQAVEQATPKLHRVGKKLLAHVGSIPAARRGVINVWRDMTIAEQFMTARYQPHQGAKECARRLKQIARGQLRTG